MSLPRYGEYKDSGVEWLGQVPEHWQVLALSRVLQIPVTDGPHSTPTFCEEGIPFLSVDGIQDGELVFEGCRFISHNDHLEFSRKAAPRENDILMGKAASIGKIARVKTSEEFSIWSPLALIRVSDESCLPAFAEYALKSSEVQAQVTTLANSNTQLNIGMKDIPKLRFGLPTLSEQTAIATFLDRETGKIDALIAEQEKLLRLLAEKRQATISHAVTKGLNPDAPMKDSGVAWLGEVPEHWQVKRMKYVVHEGIAGPYGSSLTKTMYVASGYRVYGQQQVIPNDFSVGDYYISEEKFCEMSRYQVRHNDILISVMGTIGRAALVPDRVEPGIINPRLVLYRVRNEFIAPRYLQTFINNPTSQKYFSLAAQGTTMEGLNMVSIGELQIPLPSHNEQQEILLFLNTETAKLDSLKLESERAIALLKERRAALISAAVTGQIDVRGVVAS